MLISCPCIVPTWCTNFSHVVLIWSANAFWLHLGHYKVPCVWEYLYSNFIIWQLYLYLELLGLIVLGIYLLHFLFHPAWFQRSYPILSCIKFSFPIFGVNSKYLFICAISCYEDDQKSDFGFFIYFVNFSSVYFLYLYSSEYPVMRIVCTKVENFIFARFS